METWLILTLIMGTIIFIVDFMKEITYKGIAEGNIMHEAISNHDGKKHYKYTISYLVNGKTYILQQKAYGNLKLSNKKIIIKYNEKFPGKSRIKGENFWSIGILLIFISLMGIFIEIWNNLNYN